MKKALCVCKHGNSRSVGCAFLLKRKYGMDALACGIRSQSRETIAMLCEWADVVLVMDSKLMPLMPGAFADKTILIDVGTDRYFRGWRHELPDLCDRLLKEKGIVPA